MDPIFGRDWRSIIVVLISEWSNGLTTKCTVHLEALYREKQKKTISFEIISSEGFREPFSLDSDFIRFGFHQIVLQYVSQMCGAWPDCINIWRCMGRIYRVRANTRRRPWPYVFSSKSFRAIQSIFNFRPRFEKKKTKINFSFFFGWPRIMSQKMLELLQEALDSQNSSGKLGASSTGQQSNNQQKEEAPPTNSMETKVSAVT